MWRMSAGRGAARPQFPQGRGAGGFGELAAVGIQHQPVMVISRRGQAQEMLEQPVHGGRPEQILPAHNMCDPLLGIVHHHAQMIARRHVLPSEHGIAPDLRRGRDLSGFPLRPGPRLRPGQRARLLARGLHIDAQGIRLRRQLACARPATANSRCPDKAAHRPDRAAKALAPSRVPSPCGRYRRGSRAG